MRPRLLSFFIICQCIETHVIINNIYLYYQERNSNQVPQRFITNHNKKMRERIFTIF